MLKDLIRTVPGRSWRGRSPHHLHPDASAYFNAGLALLHVNDLIRAEHCLRQEAAPD